MSHYIIAGVTYEPLHIHGCDEAASPPPLSPPPLPQARELRNAARDDNAVTGSQTPTTSLQESKYTRAMGPCGIQEPRGHTSQDSKDQTKRAGKHQGKRARKTVSAVREDCPETPSQIPAAAAMPPRSSSSSSSNSGHTPQLPHTHIQTHPFYPVYYFPRLRQ